MLGEPILNGSSLVVYRLCTKFISSNQFIEKKRKLKLNGYKGKGIYDSSRMKEIILGQGSELIDIGDSSTLHANIPIMRPNMD